MSVDTEQPPIYWEHQTQELPPLRFDELLSRCPEGKTDPDYVRSGVGGWEIAWLVMRLAMGVCIGLLAYPIIHSWLVDQQTVQLHGPAVPGNVRPSAHPSATPHVKVAPFHGRSPSMGVPTTKSTGVPRETKPTQASTPKSREKAGPTASPVGRVALPTKAIAPVATLPTDAPTGGASPPAQPDPPTYTRYPAPTTSISALPTAPVITP